MRTPRAVRPLYMEYMTVGRLLSHTSSYLYMTRRDFVSVCMFYSNGSMNPNRASEIYDMLMADAGLEPLNDGDSNE